MASFTTQIWQEEKVWNKWEICIEADTEKEAREIYQKMIDESFIPNSVEYGEILETQFPTIEKVTLEEVSNLKFIKE